MGAPGALPSVLVAALCDRHTGIGADGVIRVLAGEDGADFRMDYYNADGSEAEMCGNGIRCLVHLERRAGRLGEGDHFIATKTRVVTVRTTGARRYTVDMGEPVLRPQMVSVDGETYSGTNVSMGNPHFVLFVPELSDDLVLGLGSRLEVHPDFPNKTNVEFAVVENATKLRLRVWERGIGETLACGSGTCAAVVASATLERTGPHVLVTVPGGELEVEWDQPGHVWLTGPAEEVFTGEIDRDWLAARGLEIHTELLSA
jgi:diaminopimelate epimerase